MFEAILVIVAFFAVIIIYARIKGKRRRSEVDNMIQSSGYELSYMSYNDSLSQVFGVDDTKQRIVIVDGKEIYSVLFEDLIGADVRVDGNIVTSTSTGSLVGRTLVAGAVGALTAEKETKQVIKDINVVIRTRSVARRIIDLSIMQGGSSDQQRYIHEANRIADLVNIIAEDHKQEAK